MKFADGPKIAVHIEMANGAIHTSRLSLSAVFTCTGADQTTLDWIDLYLKGKAPQMPLTSGTPFQRDVLEAMQMIPFGETATYGELARLCGRPLAARAVGSACKRNPFPLFIPCHRIVGANGGIGGFACGLEIKRRLLEYEADRKRSAP